MVLEAKVASLESMEGLLRREREDCSMLRQELHQQQAEAQELKSYISDLQQQCQQLKNKYEFFIFLSEIRCAQHLCF